MPSKLIEFALQLDGKFSVCQTLLIMQRQGKVISVLSQFIGRPEFEQEGIATFEEIKHIVDKYIGEVAERRRQMRK